jgi:cytochrome c-type biogenesis protein CcmH
MVWVIFALVTGACVLCAVWPLAKGSGGVSSRATDAAFYRAQLAEIERDQKRGLIEPEAAQRAQVEAARRLLAATAAEEAAAPMVGSPARRRLATALVIIVIPFLSLALYGIVGNPQLPDQPLAARLAAPLDRQDIAAAVARIEAHLATNPNDGRGYEVLAPVYMHMGRYGDAARAYLNAMHSLGDTPERRAAYAEALVYAADGIVTAEARQSFEGVLKRDPTVVMAQFYLALAAEQGGDFAGARAILSHLVTTAPADASWLGMAKEKLGAVEQKLASAGAASVSETAPAPPQPAKDAAAASAIAALPPGEQKAAIEQMVERLAARLDADGRDVDGWLRLIRAYSVLQRPQSARDAWTRARQEFGPDSEAATRLDALAHELGLGG